MPAEKLNGYMSARCSVQLVGTEKRSIRTPYMGGMHLEFKGSSNNFMTRHQRDKR